MARISRRSFVAAPADDVWDLAVDFGQWHPRLRETPEGPERPAELVVQVLERDDAARTLSYTMPEPPFPIADHRATITVEDDGRQTSYVEWSADFTADESLLHALEDEIGDDVFYAAIDRLATAAQDAR